MTPQCREKTAKTAVFRPFFDSADSHEKLYGRSRLYASAQGRHETDGVLLPFSSLSFDISMKNSVQRGSSDIRGLLNVKIRKMALGSNDLSTLSLRRPETLFISHENANFLFSAFRVVHAEAKTPKIMGCCRANFAFLHALKIGTFREK